jgi:hypothetical protein
VAVPIPPPPPGSFTTAFFFCPSFTKHTRDFSLDDSAHFKWRILLRQNGRRRRHMITIYANQRIASLFARFFSHLCFRKGKANLMKTNSSAHALHLEAENCCFDDIFPKNRKRRKPVERKKFTWWKS